MAGVDSWAQYLARGAFNHSKSTVIYHLSEVEVYERQLPSGNYIPPTFEQDGKFIHATEDPSMLMAVANHFYKSSKSQWICLEIDPRFLGCAVIYEAPAPVGDTPAMPWVKPGEAYPHIYGTIPTIAVSKILKVNRNEQGEFVSIDGL